MSPKRNILFKFLGMVLTGGSGSAGYYCKEQLSQIFLKKKKADALATEDYGIPDRCIGFCDLGENDLKKIKFEKLGGGTATAVTGLESNQKVTLTITTDGQKKYIFRNEGNKDVKIKAGSKTLLLKSNSSTEFTGENNRLRKLLGEFGLPKECISSSQCSLAPEELEEILFKGFDTASGDVRVTSFSEAQAITLKIEEPGQYSSRKKYIFKNNHSTPIDITRGNVTVTLEGTKDNKFSVENDKLKKIELSLYGLPKECFSSPQCTLDDDDLREIKFANFGDEGGNVTVNSSKQTITLKIDSTDSNRNKYIFTNDSDSEISIQKDSKDPVTLKRKGKTKFTLSGEKLNELKQDSYGFPVNCNDENKCNLTEDDLEDIKFQALGEGTNKVSVTDYPENQTIKLGIIGSGTEKRYIFTNETPKTITINRGSANSLSLNASGKTKFTIDDEKLKELKLDNYGVPVDCETKVCTLEEDDLKDIKFKDLDGGGVVTLTNHSQDKKITLTIEKNGSNRKYIFTNGSDKEVKIQKGSGTPVTLRVGKTRFSDDNGRLKEIELGSYGLPSACISKTTCDLTQDDLERVSFEVFEGNGEATVTGLSANGTISLKIDGTGSTQKYIFSNETDGEVKVKKGSEDQNSVTFKSKRKTKFMENNDKLKNLELGNYGLPSTCDNGSQCSLTADDLEDVRFEALGEDDDASGAVVVSPDNIEGQKISLTIETDEKNKKKYIFSNSSGEDIKIQRSEDSSKTLTIKSKGDTKFSGDDSNQKLKALEYGEYGLPAGCTEECKLSADDLEDVKFKVLGEDSEGIVTVSNYPPTEQNQKISLKIETIPGTNDKKYIFSNSSNQEVVIQRGEGGNKKVTLGIGKSRFTVSEGKLEKETLSDDFNLPKRCTSGSECQLTADDLEQIKFQKLGNGGQVSVTEFSNGQTITLKIIDEASGNSKRYIFTNSAEKAIKIQSGSESNSITIKAKADGKTRFVKDNGSGQLKEYSVGSYGLPEDCLNNGCSLIEDDLEQIKFKDFADKGDATVTNLDSGKKVELKIIDDASNNKKYIFKADDSDSNVTIQKGSSGSVTLKAKRKTKFSVEGDNKLKPLELGKHGLPKSCDSGSSCTLVEDDLEDVKFEGFEDDKDSTVSNFPTTSNKNISIKIVTESDGQKKRYIFDNTSNDKPITINRGGKSESLSAKGKTRFKVEGEKLKKIVVGTYGLPKDCSSSCDLYEDDLEEISFKTLEDVSGGEKKITVSGLSSGKSISLKVIDGTNKKYVFDNSTDADVDIQRVSGSEKVTLNKGKKTKFSGDDGKLKPLELDKYGLPKNCETATSCTLTADDLEDVKFSALGEDSDGNVTVSELSGQTISLKIETIPDTSDKKYIFNNTSTSEITIKRGNDKTLTLGTGKTRFTVDNSSSKLKKLELETNGLPKRCSSSASSSSECKLTEDDLEQVKFEDLNGEGSNITGFPANNQITLKIVTDSSNKKRYIFNNETSQEIDIKKGDTQSVTLGTGKTRFNEEGQKLKKLTVGNFGLPSSCTAETECTLIEDDLEQINFGGLGDEGTGGIQKITISNYPSDSSQIKLKIDSTTDPENKRYIFTNSSSENIEIKSAIGTDSTITLKKGKKTKFKEENQKLKELKPDGLGLLEGCESEKKCTLDKEDLEKVRFSALGEENGEEITVENLSDDQTIELKIDGNITKKYIFVNKTENDVKIQKGSDGSNSVTLTKQKKTKFTVDNGKLKQLELEDHGLPISCKDQTTCTLNEDDLKDIKFVDLGDETVDDEEVKITDFPSDSQTITVNIETIESGTKKYKFDNSKNSSEIKIERGSGGNKKEVILAGSQETTFTDEGGKLKKEEGISH